MNFGDLGTPFSHSEGEEDADLDSEQSDSGIVSNSEVSCTPSSLSPTGSVWEHYCVDCSQNLCHFCPSYSTSPLEFPHALQDTHDSSFIPPLLSPGQSCSQGDKTISEFITSFQHQCQHQQAMAEVFSHYCLSLVSRLSHLIVIEPDASMVYKTTAYLFDLSRNSDNVAILAQCPDLLPSVSKAATLWPPDKYADISHCLSGLLHYLSQTSVGLDALVASPSAIFIIIDYLAFPYDSILFYAVTCLHNLLIYSDTSKCRVRQSPTAIAQLVDLLSRSSNTKFLAVLVDCLQLLAYTHPPTKLAITRSGGSTAVVNILASTQYEKLIWTSVRLLKVISVCPESKRAILALGEVSLDALGRCLTPQTTPRLRLSALCVLRNLSDLAVQVVRPSVEFMERLLVCLDEPLDLTTSCVAGILSNLTCRNQHNKTLLVQLGAVSALLRQLTPPSLSPRPSDVHLEPVISCLRHLTAGHPLARTASLYIIARPGRLEALCCTAKLNSPLHSKHTQSTKSHQNSVNAEHQLWSLRRVWLGLIRNLVVTLSSPHDTIPDLLNDILAPLPGRLELLLYALFDLVALLADTIDNQGEHCDDEGYASKRQSTQSNHTTSLQINTESQQNSPIDSTDKIDYKNLLETVCTTISLLVSSKDHSIPPSLFDSHPSLAWKLTLLSLSSSLSQSLAVSLVTLLNYLPSTSVSSLVRQATHHTQIVDLIAQLKVISKCTCCNSEHDMMSSLTSHASPISVCAMVTWASKLLLAEGDNIEQFSRTTNTSIALPAHYPAFHSSTYLSDHNNSSFPSLSAIS